MRKIFVALIAGLAAYAAPAQAKALLDCPLRDAPFSVESPLIDVLLSDSAAKVMEAYMPGAIDKMPEMFRRTTAPSFASIVTLKSFSGMMGGGAGLDLSKMDAELRALPVTASDKAARCARYDDDRPSFTLPKGKPRLLLFEKMTGFRDTPSVLAANAAFKAMAERNGWALVVTDKGGVMRPSLLKQFDAVIWNNISGDVLTLTQRRAFRSYVEGGGGFLAVHGSAGDPVYFWDWYPDTLIGARFVGHPSDPQFQNAKVQVETKGDEIGGNLAPGWTMMDEWYSFAKSPRLSGAHIIATLDENSYAPGKSRFGTASLLMGDHPIVWSQCVSKGRAFYSAIGHRPETYSDSHYVKLLEQAVTWAAGNGSHKCR